VHRIVIAVAVAVAVAVGVGGGACGKSHERSIRIAAASDLTRAFSELGEAFKAKTGITPIFDFGSSGMLAKQVAEGAPFSLFAAANRDYVDQAVASGHCDGASIKQYARGRIVAWTPTGVAPPTKLDDLADPRFERIAIANPEHAPYGKAAKQALEHAGLWDKLQSRIVLGDSVQATMRYAQTKTVSVAIVALSLAVISDGGTYVPVDPSLYEPLEQSLVICGNGEDAATARQLVDFVISGPGHDVMKRYGFLLPTEELQAAAPPPSPH
jgi:molybdate transport system substrate-binding protein